MSPVWNPRDSRSPVGDARPPLHHTVPPLPPSPSTFFNSHFQTAQDKEGGGKGDSGARGFIPAHLFPACQMGRRKLSIILYLEVPQWGRVTFSWCFQLHGGGLGMGRSQAPHLQPPASEMGSQPGILLHPLSPKPLPIPVPCHSPPQARQMIYREMMYDLLAHLSFPLNEVFFGTASQIDPLSPILCSCRG